MLRTPQFAAVSLLMIAACASAPDPAASWIDFAALDSGRSTNRALACAPDICSGAISYSAAPEFSISAETLSGTILKLEPSAEQRVEANGDIHLRWVAVTPAFRFRDDVDVLLRPVGKQTTRMAVYSRSRIGLADLGTNARRIDDLVERLRQETGA
jgi:uncharacterized protein (DUF1499 family)